jgi:hypothetical protein
LWVYAPVPYFGSVLPEKRLFNEVQHFLLFLGILACLVNKFALEGCEIVEEGNGKGLTYSIPARYQEIKSLVFQYFKHLGCH